MVSPKLYRPASAAPRLLTSPAQGGGTFTTWGTLMAGIQPCDVGDVGRGRVNNNGGSFPAWMSWSVCVQCFVFLFNLHEDYTYLFTTSTTSFPGTHSLLTFNYIVAIDYLHYISVHLKFQVQFSSLHVVVCYSSLNNLHSECICSLPPVRYLNMITYIAIDYLRCHISLLQISSPISICKWLCANLSLLTSKIIIKLLHTHSILT